VADVQEIAKGFIPDINLGGVFSVGVWLILIFVFAVICGIATYFIVVRLRYKNKIVIWEKVNGRFEITGRDKAMEMPLSRFGETVFYLQKRKKYLPRPNKQVGRRMYFFFIRDDGQWINVDMEDIDTKSKRMRIHFTDKSMNYARTQIERALKERYDKPNFFEKYGTIIVSVVFVVLIGILTWLLFDKWIELARITNEGVTQSNLLMEKSAVVMDKLGNLVTVIEGLCQGGSGVIQR
jgi:ABC-type multidrug transport system fused ATPase/permease subunit